MNKCKFCYKSLRPSFRFRGLKNICSARCYSRIICKQYKDVFDYIEKHKGHCLFCDKVYTLKYIKQKFCSIECKKQYNYKNRVSTNSILNKNCEVCGKEFIYNKNCLGREGKRKYCSKKCNNASKTTTNYRMYNNAKIRAKEKNMPFNITIKDLIIPVYCPVLGIKIEHGIGKPHDGSPSLDRLIPELGYVKGNIVVISHKANMIKSIGTAEEHLKVAEYIKQNTRNLE